MKFKAEQVYVVDNFTLYLLGVVVTSKVGYDVDIKNRLGKVKSQFSRPIQRLLTVLFYETIGLILQICLLALSGESCAECREVKCFMLLHEYTRRGTLIVYTPTGSCIKL